MSCSPGLTDEGVIALAKVLLLTLTELDFVKCAIRDDGGAALLKSDYKADRLRMICAEGKNFSKAIKAKFALLAQEEDGSPSHRLMAKFGLFNVEHDLNSITIRV